MTTVRRERAEENKLNGTAKLLTEPKMRSNFEQIETTQRKMSPRLSCNISDTFPGVCEAQDMVEACAELSERWKVVRGPFAWAYNLKIRRARK